MIRDVILNNYLPFYIQQAARANQSSNIALSNDSVFNKKDYTIKKYPHNDTSEPTICYAAP